MRLNKKIITRIAVLSLPAVMPVSLVMIARQMNAELPDATRDMLKLKGMI